MADKVIGAKLTVDGSQATQSVGNFKKELRDAQKEVIGLSEKFGATSKEAIAAAQKVAKLKDAIGDAKALSDAFSPDAKFNAFAGAIQGAVSGFSALQGAQALFGSESEELNKTLLKVQGALALSQGLNGILAAKDAFVNLSAVIKAQVLTAFGTLRAAIISTGIGALVVGIGLLITNFEKVKSAIINLIPGAETFFNVIGDVTDAVKGWFGASEDVLDTQKALEGATKDLTSALGNYYSEVDRVVKIEKLRAQVAGKSADDIQKFDEAAIKAKINFIDRQIKLAKEYGIATVTLEQERQKLLDDLEVKRLENQAATADRIRSQRKKADEDFFSKNLEEIKKQNNLLPAQIEQINRNIADDTKKVLADQVQGTKDKLQEDADNREAINQRITEQRRSAFDEMAAIEEQERLTKLETYGVLANAAETFAGIIGKQTAVGKALAIAGALINTYKGASEVIGAKTTLPEPFGTIQKIASVASIIATGIKQVKAITAVKVPGGGGGGGSVPSAPSVQTLRPTNATTTLDQGSINQIGNAAGRAFVLETDVTNNQERIRRLNRAARIS